MIESNTGREEERTRERDSGGRDRWRASVWEREAKRIEAEGISMGGRTSPSRTRRIMSRACWVDVIDISSDVLNPPDPPP